MELRYTPQRSDRKVDYELNKNILTITENDESIEVNLDELPEEHNYPIVGVTDDSVTVIRFYGEEEKHIFE